MSPFGARLSLLGRLLASIGAVLWLGAALTIAAGRDLLRPRPGNIDSGEGGRP